MIGGFKVANWDKFQHYRNRNPPWIKLYVELLGSEDWVIADDDSKLLMVVCMMVAARHNGLIPNNPEYIRRVAYLSKKPNLKPLIDCGFLVPSASDLLADCKHDASTLLATSHDASNLLAQRERERERERDKDSCAPGQSSTADQFEQFWNVCPRKIGKGAARKAYASAIKKIAPDVLLNEMRRYASSRKGTDEKFTVYPATWLNQERWADGQKSGAQVFALNDAAQRAEMEARRKAGLV